MFITPQNRFRIYIDETGTHVLKNVENDDNIRYLSLTGLIFRQDLHDGPVHGRLEKIKEDLFGHSADNPVILHRKEIVDKIDPFAALRNPAIEYEFNARFYALVAEAPFTSITVSIDKLELRKKYTVWRHDPYHYCLECMLERYILWLERKKFVGDAIVESRTKATDKSLKRSYARMYNVGSDFVKAAVAQRRLTTKQLKLATKEKNISGIQMADLLAHPALKAMKYDRLQIERPDHYGQKLIKILEKYKYMRNPKNKLISGWGQKWLP